MYNFYSILGKVNHKDKKMYWNIWIIGSFGELYRIPCEMKSEHLENHRVMKYPVLEALVISIESPNIWFWTFTQ